jgi:hypothetical protein
VYPADLLGAGGVPLVTCEDLGLVCFDQTSGARDELSGLSFGADFSDDALPPVEFSVAAGSQGMPGTAVRLEAGCTPAQQQADVFSSHLDTANSQDLDGDGQACATNAGYGLLIEEDPAHELDALEADPCRSLDFDCNGLPDSPVYFTLEAGSPSLTALGAAPSDILAAGSAYVLEVWAAGETQLGLAAGDVIDAICLQEDGDGQFSSGDRLLFSLAPGSPSLAAIRATPADLLRANPLGVFLAAGSLGLLPGDDVDALLCGSALDSHRLHFPVVIHP